MPNALRNPVHPWTTRDGSEVALAIFVYSRFRLTDFAAGQRLLEGGELRVGIRFLHEPEVDALRIPPLHLPLLPPQHEGCRVHLLTRDFGESTGADMPHTLD